MDDDNDIAPEKMATVVQQTLTRMSEAHALTAELLDQMVETLDLVGGLVADRKWLEQLRDDEQELKSEQMRLVEAALNEALQRDPNLAHRNEFKTRGEKLLKLQREGHSFADAKKILAEHLGITVNAVGKQFPAKDWDLKRPEREY